MRHESDLERVVPEGGDRQRDAVDRDRSLLDAIAEDLRRRLVDDAHGGAAAFHQQDPATRVDMSLNVVPAERIASPQSGLDVQPTAERFRALASLRDDIEGEAAVLYLDDGEAHAVEGDRVA